ncbi:uncharacterized protein LOC105217540 [Zeugodacus cucurbitae]|uniref:uncharacterized protein LOC105217540 n=1 Tax=Zeugodacus cucurbitae TaxID=28588 RepID=UPI000596A232|nr:uncharacterized protein LOC105217540 [Zeugodacus cucurbitae]
MAERQTIKMAKINIELLISCVQSRPLLWQDRLPNFKNKNITDMLWSEVGKICGCAGETAKTKWKNLKDSYRKILQKILTGSKPMKISWPYFEMMSFIKDTMAADPIEIKLIPNKRRKKDTPISNDIEFVKLESEEIEIPKKETELQENSDDLYFFKSLLPVMEKFDQIEKLEIRGEIQNLLLNKLKLKENKLKK